MVKKHLRKIIIGAIVVIIGWLVYGQVTAEPAGITTTLAKRGTLVTEVTANGKIQAKKKADLKFLAPGKVVWVGVKKGDQINAWQGVASQETTALNAAYQQALNNYRNAQAAAEVVLDQVKNHTTNENFDFRATRTAAEVDRDNAYDAVKAAEANLSQAMLVSPIAGTVVETNNLEPGINLSGSDLESKIIRIVDLKSMYFAANADEVDYGQIKPGQAARVEVDAFPGQDCRGEVSEVGKNGQETAGGVVTIPVEIKLVDCPNPYAAGLNGQAYLIVDKLEQVLIIPKKYLVQKSGRNYVYKQTGSQPKNRQLTEVTAGRANLTEVEIKSGLNEGDKIVFVP